MAGKIDSVNAQAKDYTIVDSDFHIGIHDSELLLPYVESDVLRNKMEKWGLPSYAKTGWDLSYAQDLETGTRTHGLANDIDTVNKAMDELHLDAVIATPGGIALLLPRIRWTMVKNELAVAYNNYLLENVINPKENIYGLFVIPEWNRSTAIDEIYRMSEYSGIVGAASTIDPWQHTAGQGTERDPIFEALVDNDMPLVLHQSGKDDPYLGRNQTRESRVETTSLAFPFNAMSDVANMILTGVFDKYPELDVIVQECGTNWIPFLGNRLDDQLQRYSYDIMLGERTHQMGQKHLEKMPSEYIRDNFYFSTQPIALPRSPNHSKAMLEMCNAGDSFLFATDYPHGTIDVADWVFDNPGIDENLSTALFSENSEKAFNIEV